jgi:translation initiation factor 3 subunit B
MPTDEQGQSKGFMFVTLENEGEAQVFMRAMHGHSFDKRHTFRVIPFGDVDRYDSLSEEWVDPPTEEWAPRVSRALLVL